MNRLTAIFATGAWTLALLALLTNTQARGESGAESLNVPVGRSIVVDYPEDIARISTSNPDVADYVPVSNREILLHARGVGIATLVVWAKSGHRTFYTISVEPNLDPARDLIKRTFPGEQVDIHASRDTITLTGTVSSSAIAERATVLVTPLAKSVVNNLSVRTAPAEKQILLRVKFAELNRSAVENFGVNLLSTGAANTPGVISTGQFSPPRPSALNGVIGGKVTGTESTFNLTDVLNIFAFRPDLNLAATIKALRTNGVLQILAEPNLVTSNDKEASFLVGGEFPVPIVQGGQNAGAITVQFREFGIRLTFKPQLMPAGTLKMTVKPEVSTIDITNAVNVGGFTIPALATRRIDSTVELAPGQSFVIGGLIDDRTTENMARIPGLSNIPLLGMLFKSRSENRTKSELLVIVSPEIVEPLAASDPRLQPHLPLDLLSPTLIPVRPDGAAAPLSANPEDRRKAKPGVTAPSRGK